MTRVEEYDRAIAYQRLKKCEMKNKGAKIYKMRHFHIGNQLQDGCNRLPLGFVLKKM